MPLTRRALILSALAAGGMAPLASTTPVPPRTPRPAGIWRSRTTADLVVLDGQFCRTYTCYDTALVLVDEASVENTERETLETRLGDAGDLELEYWGTVTRFRYDRLDGWPALEHLGDGAWVSDPGTTVAAFFDALTGHFAFAGERGIDW